MNDITVIKEEEDPHGGRSTVVLYWYDIAADPVNDFGGTKVVVQPSGTLPGEVAPLVDAAGVAALDAGDAGYEVHRRYRTAGETLGAFATRVLADHAQRETWWLNNQKARYGERGRSTSSA